MKFFVDTAMIDEIRQAMDLGICDGVTTNPSLVAMTGKTLDAVVSEITEVVDGPISVEATALDYEGMLKEAREIAAIHPNIVVKIPMTREGIKTVSKVSAEGIKTNVTLLFSATQALLAAKAGATYVSPFVGRVDDISGIGMEVIQQIQMIYANYDFGTEVLVASIRNPIHVLEAAQMGADVATIPFGVMDKLFNHPLTDIGIAKFVKDWERVPK